MSKERKPQSLSDVINARRNAASTRDGYRSLLARVVLLAAAGYVLLTQVFLITQMRGQSMFPAMKDGDLIIGYRLQGEYAKGDVIAYTAGGETRVGRIAAREGDNLSMDESGVLYVNGPGRRDHLSHLSPRRRGIPPEGAGRLRVRVGRLSHHRSGQPGFRPHPTEGRAGQGDYHPAQKGPVNPGPGRWPQNPRE